MCMMEEKEGSSHSPDEVFVVEESKTETWFAIPVEQFTTIVAKIYSLLSSPLLPSPLFS